jgi:hypothetical protein
MEIAPLKSTWRAGREFELYFREISCIEGRPLLLVSESI